MSKLKDSKLIDTDSLTGWFLIAVIASLPCAWFTHVVVSLINEAWGLLIAGAIMFPIGIIHGYGLWFGFF